MEQVLLNPGFDHIAKKILKNMDFPSVKELGKTNKNFLKMCHAYLMTNSQGILYYIYEYESLLSKFKMDLIDPSNKLGDFFTFLCENKIHHENYFKYHYIIRNNQESREILETFLKKLLGLTKLYQSHISVSDELSYEMGLVERFLSTFMSFIPSNCPITSKKNLMELLAFDLAE